MTRPKALSLTTRLDARLAAAFAILFFTASVAGAASPLIHPRGTVDIRVEPTLGSATWTETEAPAFVNIPRMSASFVAEQNATNLAITFSAEAMTSASNKRMFIRALVDGVVADPSNVVFTEGSFGGARSFTFTHVVDQGIHTVEIQWIVDAGATASMRAASLQLRHGRANTSDGTLTHETPPSDDQQTTRTAWVPFPARRSCSSSPPAPIRLSASPLRRSSPARRSASSCARSSMARRFRPATWCSRNVPRGKRTA